MSRIRLITVALLALVSQICIANTAVIQSYVPAAAPVGQMTLRFMLFDVYEATLYAPDGEWQRDKPFALSLRYLRNLDGDAIAERSVKEIRGQGFDNETKLNAWGKAMADIFPDVKKDTTIIGLLDATQTTRFYFEGKPIGQIEDPEFGEQFFNIWLGERTSEPKLRDQLLGK